MIQESRKLRLGDILLHHEVITEAQLAAAFEFQKKHKDMRLGDCLIECGFITGDDIAMALHLQLSIPVIDLHGIKIPRNHRISKRLCT